jgi:hypothetical protein
MTLGAGKLGMIVFAAGLACGCANSGFDLSTASVTTDKTATAAKADPICVSLANQINSIKGDGTIERLEKAAAGKTAKVQVKREALQKQAELNKANSEFQTRCGPTIPQQVAAQAAPAPAAAQAPAKQAANAPASTTPAASTAPAN